MLICRAADARKLNDTTSPLVRSPESYSGSLDAFIAEYVLPNLPSAGAVEEFHSALTSYAARPDALFLVRAVSGMNRGTLYTTRDGTRLRATDNAPAWWVHSVLVHGGRIDRAHFAEVMESVPAHFFEIGRSTLRTASRAGWHIAHLFQVKDGDTGYGNWRRSEVIRRFVRSVHPCNYFPVAKRNWARWGGDQRVLATMAGVFSDRYAAVWAEFLELAQSKPCELPARADDIVYSYGPAVRELRSEAPAPAAEGRSLAEGIDKQGSVPEAEYHASRLTFRRDVIDALDTDSRFRIVTPSGSYLMSRTEFEEAFPNVIRSKSYRVTGVYHYPSTPRRAEAFRE